MQKCFFDTVALTALHAAGNDGCIKHVDDLLEAGATVSAGALDGRTPLSVACWWARGGGAAAQSCVLVAAGARSGADVLGEYYHGRWEAAAHHGAQPRVV